MAQILQSLVFFDKESKFIVIFHDCAARFVPRAWSETLMKGLLATRPIYSRGFRYCQLVTSLSLEISIYEKQTKKQAGAATSFGVSYPLTVLQIEKKRKKKDYNSY